MNARFSGAGLLIVLTISLLAGCLSIETTIRFDDRESGSIEMLYEIDEEYVAEGVIDGPSGVLPIPVSKDELRRSAAGIEGISLERYQSGPEGHRHVVRAAFRFSSLAALNRFYAGVAGAGGNGADAPIRFVGDVYEQLVFGGFDEPVRGDEREFLELLIGGERLAFRVLLPESIAAFNMGEREGEREAYAELRGEDLFDSVEPVYWRIEME